LDGIFCSDCGAELAEAPTLLPDRRPPCPWCGSLARRFEQEITDTVVLSDSGTATDTLSAALTNDPATIAHAGAATLTVTAHDATAQTVNAHGIPSADPVGDAAVVRGPRIIRDRLVVMGRHLLWMSLTHRSAEMSRSLWWVQLTTQPTWLVQVVDEAGDLIDMGIEDKNDHMVALAGVANQLLPSAAGLMLLTVVDQAGEVLAISTTDNPVKTLAAVTDALLPRHPG
jgi:hypothetical protein